MANSQTTPWDDFFGVYLELIQALKGEVANNDPITAEIDAFISKIKAGHNQDEWHKATVHEVVARFRGKSKDILLQEPTYFNEPLVLFPGIDNLDISKLWNSHPMYRNGLWAWIEQIYIIGNVCLHPNRKDKFLQIVRQIKASKPGSNLAAEPEESEDVPDMSGAIKEIAGMMGIGDNAPMLEMMGEVSQHMQKIMSSSGNPMEIVQQLLNGDTSCLGDLDKKMQDKMAQKIQSGELSEEQLVQQRENMLKGFGGMGGIMQMASGLGLNVGPMSQQTGVEPTQSEAAPTPRSAPVKAPTKTPSKGAPSKKSPTTKGAPSKGASKGATPKKTN